VAPNPHDRPIRFDLVNVALATAVVVIVVGAFQFLYLIQSVLILLLLAIILATAIEPAVRYLRRVGFRRSESVLVIFLIATVLLIAVAFLAIQTLTQEFAQLVIALPSLTRNLGTMAITLPAGPLRATALWLLSSAGSAALQQDLTSTLSTGTLSGIVFATLTILQAVFAIVTMVVIAYFWIEERLTIRHYVLRLLSPDKREGVRDLWDSVELKLGAWARGQMTLMVVVALMQGLAYVVFGVPFALLLAVYAGLAEAIPMLGPYLGAAPAVLIALTVGPKTALLVVGYTIVVELIESNVLVPRIMEHAVGLSPLTVILALLAGAAIYGVIGALLAVPVAAAVQLGLAELTAKPTATVTPIAPESRQQRQ
jgi:predicted PurR-regulated permease PerM